MSKFIKIVLALLHWLLRPWAWLVQATAQILPSLRLTSPVRTAARKASIVRACLTALLLIVLTSTAWIGTSAQTLTRSASGLLYQTDFSASAGWTAGTGWGFDNTAPTYTTFRPTPITFEYSPSGTGNDSGGAREFHGFVDGDGSWYLLYGAGDSTGSSFPWRIQLAKSTDRGLTWTKLGPINIGLSDGASGTVAAADMLYMEKIGSTYYLHAMTAGSQVGGVPAFPYQSRLWTNSSLAVTGWTFANTLVGSNSIGTIDTSDNYSGSVVGSNSGGTAVGTAVYHLFTSVRTTGGLYGIGHLTSTSRTSGFTAASVSNPIAMPSTLGIENPKVLWSGALGKWVMFVTTFPLPGGNSFSTNLYTSSNLSTWTPSNTTGLILQHATPLHGLSVGANILSPIYAVGGAPNFDANGYIPCTYDADPSGILDTINSGRHGRFVVAEPAPYALHFAPSLTTLLNDNFASYTSGSSIFGQGGWVRAVGTNAMVVSSSAKLDLGNTPGDSSVVNTSTSMQDGTVSADITLDASCSVGIITRYVDNTHFNLTDVQANPTGSKITAVQYRGGTAYTSVGTSVDGAANSWVAGSTHNVKVVISNTLFSVYIDNAFFTSWTDSVTTPTAGYIGFRNGAGGTGQRLVDNVVVTTGSASAATCYRTLSHSDFAAEFAVTFPGTGAGSVGFDFHVSDANNFKRLSLPYGGKLALQHSVGGTLTTLPYATGSIVTATGYQHYLSVESRNGLVTARLDGESQISYMDTAFSSGTQIGFYASGGAEVQIRSFHMRQGNTVTVQGRTPGHTLVPRTPGGLPIGSYTVPASGIVSFEYSHFPLGAISDNGTDYTPADGGYIWGGDALGVATTVPLRPIGGGPVHK